MPFGYPVSGIRPSVGVSVTGMPGLSSMMSTGIPVVLNAIPTALNAPAAMNPDTTGYFGNLSPNVSDEVVTAVLGCSGGFKRLKRPSDPSTGKTKPFALVEFDSVDDLNRAFRVFQDFVLDHRHLSIKIEGGKDEISKMVAGEGDLKIYETICRVLIGKKMTAGGSMEWLEKRIEHEQEKVRAAKRQSSLQSREQSGQGGQSELAKDRRDSRQRNYSDLVDDSAQFTKTLPSMNNANTDASMSSMSLKERERRWEGKAWELERELRRDLEKDAERAKRHEKETFALREHISNYSDALVNEFGSLGGELWDSNDSTVSFFANREKWRNLRELAQEKEEEIFGECLRIRAEMHANSVQKLAENEREFIEKRLPTEREELFAFPVDWRHWTDDLALKFKELCRERVAAYFKNAKEAEFHDKIGDFLFEQVSQKQAASTITRELKSEPAFLAVCSEAAGEAELLVMIIWRWLIYLLNF